MAWIMVKPPNETAVALVDGLDNGTFKEVTFDCIIHNHLRTSRMYKSDDDEFRYKDDNERNISVFDRSSAIDVVTRLFEICVEVKGVF